MASKVRILTSQITHAAKKFGDDTLKLWLKEKRSQITRAAKKFGDASLKLAWLKVKGKTAHEEKKDEPEEPQVAKEEEQKAQVNGGEGTKYEQTEEQSEEGAEEEENAEEREPKGDKEDSAEGGDKGGSNPEGDKEKEESGEFFNKSPENCIAYLLYQRKEPNHTTEVDLRSNGVIKAHCYSYRQEGEAKIYQKKGVNMDIPRFKARVLKIVDGFSFGGISGWWPF